MEAADACEIARLPEELLSAVLSLTTPLDAFSAAAVSRSFRAAAGSDAVWSRFVPRDLPPLAAGEQLCPAPPPSEKGRFLRLSERSAVLADGVTSMWLDRETGAKCYMLPARALNIAWIDSPWYWRGSLSPIPAECALLRWVSWLEICGKIHSTMLSQDSSYAVYIVFKLADGFYGLDYPPQDASVTFAGSTSTHNVRLHSYVNNDGRRYDRALRRFVFCPRKRTDGRFELKMGEFCNKDDNGEVCIKLMETSGSKAGLIVQGIEIRPKKGLVARSSAHSIVPINLPPTLYLDGPKGRAIKPSTALSKSKPKGEGEGEAQDARKYHTPVSKKEIFMRLSACPSLLTDHLMSMWLDKHTGTKCCMLSARALNIAWGDTPRYWRWIQLTSCSFSEAAELLSVCWLEIRGKINSKMLSKHSTYAVYIVFKLTNRPLGLDYSVQEASVSIGESKSTHRVCLQSYTSEDEEEDPQPLLPQKRGDGWMELELGQFYNDEGEDGDVSISLAETVELNNKGGLIVQGIEIRAGRS